MGSPIILLSQEAASNTDVLQGTRLQSLPNNGILTFELQGSVATPTNNHAVTIQLPSGSTPVNSATVPADGTGTVGIIDDRLSLKFRFRVTQGGHCVFGTVLTGTSTLTWRTVFYPA